MTEHEARIEQLVTSPPTVQWSWRQRLTVLGAWMLALVAVAGITVAIVRIDHVATKAKSAASQAQEATREIQAAVTCINTLLGDRGPLTTADSNAEIDLFGRIFAVLFAPAKDQPALYQQLLKAAPGDLATLRNDKAIRSTHPLGHC